MKILFSVLLIAVSFFCVAQAPQLVIPKGHNGDVTLLAISPDKKWLASGDEKGAVKLWDMQTSKELKTFYNNPELSILGQTTGLTFSPDGKKLYTGIGSSLIINDLLNAGKEILNKKIHEDKITQILFSTNGKAFVTAADNQVKIWDADNLASPKVVAIKGKKPKLAFDDANNIIVITTGNYMQVSSSFDITDIITNKGYITHINTATGQVIVTDEFENLKDDGIYISPNGKLLAITRYEESVGTVQLLDIASKKIIKKITGIQDSSINLLSFSKNNRYMATKAGKSIILYDLASLAYEKTFYSEDIFSGSILFNEDGTKLLQGISLNGSVVQWNLKESKVEKVFGSGANYVKDLAVTPDQQSLIMLYGSSDYRGEYFLQKLDFNSTVLSKIKSTGIVSSMQNEIGDRYIASAGGGRLFEPGIVNMADAILSNQTVTDFCISNNNKMLVTTNQYESQPQLSFYNVEDGKKISNVPLQRSAYSFLFSKDDKILYVGYGGSNKIDKIEIQTGTILKTFEHIDSYSKDRKIKYMLLSKDESTLIGVNDFYKMYSWNTATGVESSLNIPTPDMGFSLKVIPNTNTFVYGDGGNNLEIYDLSANKIVRSFKCNSRTIGALDVTPDGKFIFYCNNDKSVSVWDLTKGALVATMVFFGEKDWVIVDKAGRFDGTQTGMRKMHYSKGLDVLPLESGYEQFYTPNLLPRILNNEKFTAPVVDINNIKAAPVVKISVEEQQRNLSVEDDITIYKSDNERLTIKVKADCPEDAVTEIRLYQNGKLVQTTRNLTVEDDDKTGEKSVTKIFTLNLSDGINQLKAIAFNTERTESKPAEITINVKALKIDQPLPVGTTLHLMVIGINAYKNPKYALNYALADATSFKEQMAKPSDIFSDVNVHFISDADATKATIENAFKDIIKETKEKDVFVFYYAGHGVMSTTDKSKDFYIVPYDVLQLYGADDALAQKGISAKELQQFATNIQAKKQLFILDACQSAGALEAVTMRGAAEQKAIAQLARSTGTHWLMASGVEQFATEFSQLGHGVFTYALLQGLKGAADNGDKQITINELKAYLETIVPELTQKYKGTAQYPTSYGLGNDFPVEIIK